MKKKMISAIVSVVLAVGMLSASCMAAGSQTKVVETVKDSSTGKVDGQAVAVEIVAENTDMKSVNEFKVVVVPEKQKQVVNTVITATKEPDMSYADVLAAAREEGAKDAENPVEVKVVYKTVDEEGNIVILTEEEAAQDENHYDLAAASALTAPFELIPRYKEGEVVDALEEAETTLKVLELQALFEKNADNQELLDSIRIACWVTLEDGTMELQLIKPVSIDLETGNITVKFGELVPCMAQIIYNQDLAVLEEE